ncbi:YihY/virulence factor BrkB family protein [Nonomuraea dietziae]|uniref:YihY/virulence factor BrkB family protein n=1 Tax=Nonomuraea dietziae TaxID=65515 RepID=UPI0033D5424C
MWLSRWVARAPGAWQGARRRHGWLDHLVRAVVRYDRVDGGRLSAALTYYAFFATFALVLLGFSLLGHVLDDPVVLDTVQRYLNDNFPRLDVMALRQARETVGIIALIGFPLAGLFWMDALRSASRAIWQLEEYPGPFWQRQLIDLAVLTGLGLLLAISLTAAFATESLLTWVVGHTVGTDAAPARWLLTASTFTLGLLVNLLLALALLSAPPRLRLTLRRMLGPAVLITIGLQILNSLGQVYLRITEDNPAYQLVATAAVMLVFLKAANQLILLATALAATSTRGTVTDLAAEPPPAPPEPSRRRRRLRARRGPHGPPRNPNGLGVKWSRWGR